MKYRHVAITRHGGAEVLQVIEDDLPVPQPDEVRIRILATGVAFTDVLIREGLYPGMPRVPFSPGYDIVGQVDCLGEGVTDLALGQRVAALTVFGGYSEYICVPAVDLVPVPDGVDVAEAVSLVLHYVTAYQMLHRVAQVKAGETILIHGAGGGVGTALLELARLADLEIYGTDSEAKQDLIVSLGGMPIDYQNQDVEQQLRQFTPAGVDVVFDGVGGRHLGRSHRLLRPGGRLVNYGFSSALAQRRGRQLMLGLHFLRLAWLKLWPGHRVYFYSIVGWKQQHADWFRQDLSHLFHLLVQGLIRPVIADRLLLVEAARAHTLLEQGAVNGKLVLLCSS